MAATMLKGCLGCLRYKSSIPGITRRTFSHGRFLFAAHDADFDKAKERLNTLKEDPGNITKLQIYGLFKQATVGKCNVPKPGMIDFVGKAKWDAWNQHGDMSQDDAQKKYIELVDELAGKESPSSESSAPVQAGKYAELLVNNTDGVYAITLNRPTKKNAINFQMYQDIQDALEEAANDKTVTIATMTGAGDYYCSGNDLANFANVPPDGVAAMAEEGGRILKGFVASFIDFPKPLIGIINGPAVGVSVTVLGLFDAVYATDKVSFHTPFTVLGQSAEGCSSYIFPKLMGAAKANEMLMFNRKLTAVQACERGLVTEVFPEQSFTREVRSRVSVMASLPRQSLWKSKALIRDGERKILHDVNRRECDLLVERWQSDECMTAIMKFFQRK